MDSTTVQNVYEALIAEWTIRKREIWNNNWIKVAQISEAAINDENDIQRPFEISPSLITRKATVISTMGKLETAAKQEVAIITLPKIKPIPKMKRFDLTKRSRLVPDNKMLSYVPLVEGKPIINGITTDNDPDTYTGVREPWNVMDHVIFKNWINGLFNEINNSHESPKAIRALCLRDPNNQNVKDIFDAASEFILSPDSGMSPPDCREVIPDELLKKYVELTADIDESNIDVSEEQLSHAMQMLFCSQCLEYGCLKHSLDQCSKLESSSCYMLLDNEPRVDNSTWNDEEQTMLHQLQGRLFNNYCAIAREMPTKTCKEVYGFVKRGVASDNAKDKNDKYKKHQYTPCNHAGPCDKTCSCSLSQNACDKFCNCSKDCKKRFRGCRCRGKCNNNVCGCSKNLRECDPDLCTPCSASTCTNNNIRNGVAKKIMVAKSNVSGWGAFLKESAKKGDFICEYFGEIISTAESNRRGTIYDQGICTYLFELNEELNIDAYNEGNEIRFANHSEYPNMTPKIMFVNGDHRIGLYAAVDIEAGTELLFNYGKHFINKFDYNDC